MLGKIVRSQKEGVIQRWKELHKEELRYLYYSPNVITVITSRIMKLGEGGGIWHVFGRRERHAELWRGNLIDRKWKA
jgi:hypothetical protein